MGDPVGVARHARERLEPDGTVLLVEPFAIDGRGANIAGNPMAALLYTASTVVCTPNSLSQEVGLGLGAQAGEARLRQVFQDAGFTRFRRAAETPLNLILEARPRDDDPHSHLHHTPVENAGFTGPPPRPTLRGSGGRCQRSEGVMG